MVTVNDRNWNEFEVGSIFEIFNAKPYHKTGFKQESSDCKFIPYITRKNKNNGVDSVVARLNNYEINPANIIIFGAENANFFYQPFEHITGNKIYGMKHSKMNKYNGLFLQQTLNLSVKNCGFSYGQGLTGSREKRRNVMLPVKKNDTKNPDWDFMETYIKEIVSLKRNRYHNYLYKRLENIKYNDIKPLEDKNWKEFDLIDLFPIIQRGKRLIKNNQINGETPYISSTANNNGVDNFISNNQKIRNFSNCLTVANSGSVGMCFYQPFNFIASDHVTCLKNKKFNEFIYMFIAILINRFSEKYNFNREINDARISKEKIILPITEKGTPDYIYMEQYVKNIIYRKYSLYSISKLKED